MSDEALKDIYLHDELLTAFRLIEIGLGEFQNLDFANDFYHLPFQLLSSGFERLMKCHICFGYHENNGGYPDTKFLKKCGGRNGHDLLELKNKILESYFSINGIPVLIGDLECLSNDEDLNRLLYLLSEFGKYARYHNLDVITDANNPSINVKSLWEEYESSKLSANPELLNMVNSIETQSEAYSSIQREIVIKLESFIRSICRQFTIGKLGAKALQNSCVLTYFIMLNDEDLGNRDYRKQTTSHKEQKRSNRKRNIIDKLKSKFNSKYKQKTITKDTFHGVWPFYHESVTVECRDKHWCVVIIDGKTYALNGSAKDRFKLDDVHEAGVAILGKSIGPFIDTALRLGEE